MSIYKQIFATAGLFAMTAGLVVTPSASAESYAGTITTNTTNNGYSYCSAADGSGFVTDLGGSIKKTSDASIRNFYVIANGNKVNDTCPAAFVKTNYITVADNHSTSFDLDANGAPTNVKISNTNPSSYTVACSGTDTVLTINDAERDALTLNQVVKADDFNVTSSTNADGSLKVTFARKDSTVTTTNTSDVYVNEAAVSGIAGQFRKDAEGNMVAVSTSAVTEDATAKVVKLAGVTVKSPKCDDTLYTASSSSSVVSSSSSMVSSSSVVSSSAAATTVSTGKGSTVRTGGAL
jgi:hypothetical protein